MVLISWCASNEDSQGTVEYIAEILKVMRVIGMPHRDCSIIYIFELDFE
jgi:hypothetical protein